MTVVHASAAERWPVAGDSDGEARLVLDAQSGSAESFEELVRIHGPLLFRFLVLRTGDEADAKDALQETLVAAWRGIRSVRDPHSLRSWLLTLAARQAARETRRRRAVPVAAESAVPVEDGSTIDLRAAMAALSPEHRDVILLRYLTGLSERETAQALGVSVGTVKSRAARARQAIAVHLEMREEPA